MNMEKKTIIVSVSSRIINSMSIETIEKWNTLANKMSSKYDFVFIPSDGIYTTWRIVENKN